MQIVQKRFAGWLGLYLLYFRGLRRQLEKHMSLGFVTELMWGGVSF